MEEVESTPKPSRKELEKLQRKREILNAAKACFLEKGYQNTTLDEIAQRAEFGKGTIYNYFESKEELLLGLIEQFMKDGVVIAEEAILHFPGTAREKLTNYVKTVLKMGTEHEHFHMVISEIHSLRTQGFEDRMKSIGKLFEDIWKVPARLLQEEIDAGRIKPKNPFYMACMFDMMVRVFGVGTQQDKFPIKISDHDEIADLIITTFFDGMSIHSYEGQYNG